MMKILVINGPNLQLLGTRKPEIYGSVTLDEINSRLSAVARELDVTPLFFQSNSEGAIVDRIAEAKAEKVSGIVINPGAYTHTSLAIRDALEAVEIPALETHLSNIHAREEFRSKSLIAPVCAGQISGLGADGYEWAFRAIVRKVGGAKK